MTIPPFYISNLPRIDFGTGRIQALPRYIAEFGNKVLLVTGKSSFCATAHWPQLLSELEKNAIAYDVFQVSGEPSPQLIDEAVAQYYQQGYELVTGIGGGSVLDAAKAIAALLPYGNSVLDHLEDVGKGIAYTGPSLPLIAVPTTAGTGSEATKNAVLSVHGEEGYKKSFRHDCMVAKVALVDPDLLLHCPAHLIAAQGMDAFTQLLESYVSIRANPFTDSLAMGALEPFIEGFVNAWRGGEDKAAQAGRSALAYGALVSGITLAQVGLGSVHGLAQPFGSLFPIPHGVACGTTVAEATAMNINVLRKRKADSPALKKYAWVGRLMAKDASLDDAEAQQALVDGLHQWTRLFEIPRLGAYGVSEDDIDRIVAQSWGNSMKSNPVELTDAEIAEIVRHRI